MLTLLDPARGHNCQGYCRREFLKIGSLGLFGGLTLPHLLASRAQAARAGRPVTDKSVILLFLQGGPSQIECFDPKMTAPAEVRSVTGEVPTALPGVTFGGTFPQMARLADRLAVIRNYQSRNDSHQGYLPVASAGNPLKATMGALYARVAGSNHPRTGVPTNVLVLPEAVQPGLKLGNTVETAGLPHLISPGDLGSRYGAVDPSNGGAFTKTLQLQIAPDRFADRRQLLGKFDALRRQADAARVLDNFDGYQQQAFDLVSRGIVEAFDLSREDPKTVARYDTSKLFRMEEVHKWFDMWRSTNLLGRQLLMARRLCEAGCGFVTVSDSGWDMHSNANTPKNMGGMNYLGHQVDHAVAAFIEDVKERGLSDKILLVITGEMGRSPRRNAEGGRDHHGNLTPLVFVGGGLKMGQVIGQSDKHASTPAADPQTPVNLLATIMGTLLDLGEVRTMPNLGKTADIVTGAEPIPGLFPA